MREHENVQPTNRPTTWLRTRLPRRRLWRRCWRQPPHPKRRKPLWKPSCTPFSNSHPPAMSVLTTFPLCARSPSTTFPLSSANTSAICWKDEGRRRAARTVQPQNTARHPLTPAVRLGGLRADEVGDFRQEMCTVLCRAPGDAVLSCRRDLDVLDEPLEARIGIAPDVALLVQHGTVVGWSPADPARYLTTGFTAHGPHPTLPGRRLRGLMNHQAGRSSSHRNTALRLTKTVTAPLEAEQEAGGWAWGPPCRAARASPHEIDPKHLDTSSLTLRRNQRRTSVRTVAAHPPEGRATCPSSRTPSHEAAGQPHFPVSRHLPPGAPWKTGRPHPSMAWEQEEPAGHRPFATGSRIATHST